MKKYFVIPIIVLLLCTSCEEVIDVKLNTAAPRLVIEASIDWEKGTTGNQQSIKLSTTTDYFSNTIPAVSGATVFITNSSNIVFTFLEQNPNTGIYTCNNFIPVLDEVYTLTVIYNGQEYRATEKMVAVPEVIRTEQRNITEGTNNQIEVEFFFQDDGNNNNYYLFKYKTPSFLIPTLEVLDDEFQQGNEMSGAYTDEKLKPGDLIRFNLYGLSEDCYNYTNLLLSVANGAGPFSPPPATVRGNIVNQTNSNNFCFGFFRVCETDKFDYEVQ